MKEMKKVICFMLAVAFVGSLNAQSVKQKDKYGSSIVYVDGSILKSKDKYGAAAYYFEGIPEKWVIVCLIR
jgi:3-keto-L-gulonate-6-phosphate decarboxylase